MGSIVYNEDCIQGMKRYPDNYFDLAVVDPEYGIGRDGGETGKNWKWYEPKEWDNKRPPQEYWNELFRVSKNQIVWGANYFTNFLPPSMGWIYWDKGQKLTMSDGELAYTSFNRALRSVTINRCKIGEHGGHIHPTAKPVKLYSWIYKNYLPEGGKVIDTHLGSGSNRIAADKEGNVDFTAFEVDKDYFEASEKRYKDFTAQIRMF